MKRYKLFFLSVSLFFMISESRSQTEQHCVHYPYNTQLGVNLNVNLLSKMMIQNDNIKSSSSDYFSSYPSFGADLGVYLYQRIYKWFGMQVGLEYNAITIRYNISDKLFGDEAIEMRYYVSGAFTFPIIFNASYYFNERHGLDISFGGATLILFARKGGMGFDYREGGPVIGVRYGDFTLNNHYSPFNFSLYGKIGYNLLLKNKNTFGMAIIGSYAKYPYATGNYNIFDNGKIEQGYISLHNTCVGLQFSYGFTMKKLVCVPTTSHEEEN